MTQIVENFKTKKKMVCQNPLVYSSSNKQYDAQNRLTRAIVSGNTTDFYYDSKNRVVKRSLNSVSTFLIYDGWSLIEERTSAGTQQARYVHGTQIDEILTKTDSVGTIYYHHDGLGSVTQITNAIGTMIERYLYDIFGRVTMLALSGVVITTSSRGNRFFFTGRERIAEAGIYDYRNRVYSESLGRFLQTDPILFNAGDVNIYRYVGNRVNRYRDSLGLFSPTGIPAHAGMSDPRVTSESASAGARGMDQQNNNMAATMAAAAGVAVAVAAAGVVAAGVVAAGVVAAGVVAEVGLANAAAAGYTAAAQNAAGLTAAAEFASGFFGPDGPPSGIWEGLGTLADKLLDELMSAFNDDDDDGCK